MTAMDHMVDMDSREHTTYLIYITFMGLSSLYGRYKLYGVHGLYEFNGALWRRAANMILACWPIVFSNVGADYSLDAWQACIRNGTPL